MTVSAVEYTVILWHENLQFIFVGSKTRSSDQVVLFVVTNYFLQNTFVLYRETRFQALAYSDVRC